MLAYKAFVWKNGTLQTKVDNKIYVMGTTYEWTKPLQLCASGFHFCKEVAYIHDYYSLLDPSTVLTQIEVIGKIVTDEKQEKFCTNKYKLITYYSSTEPIILRDQTKVWYHKGRRHRDNDLPAIEWANGHKEWWKEGIRHRDNDLPAIEWTNGHKEWWKEGKQHRDNDLPAIEWANGVKEWWKEGKRRRDNDLPAIEYR